jgi:hypothetical protein
MHHLKDIQGSGQILQYAIPKDVVDLTALGTIAERFQVPLLQDPRFLLPTWKVFTYQV